MPYIDKTNRKQLFDLTDAIFDNSVTTAGELNYILTRVCKEYFERNGGRYQQINDIVGALEGAKLEFYRRVAAPYEDKKIQENGDVY